MILTVHILLSVGFLAYVRLAPTDVSRWHVPIGDAEDVTGSGWAARVIKEKPGALSELNRAMLKLPRTELIAGSVGEGRLTYITRSKVIGFPDFTTIEKDGDYIKLYARLRFGSLDFGVNAGRLEGLITTLKAG